MADSGSRSRPGAGPDLRWLDLLKAVAICWIFLNHLSEQLFGGPYFGNPYDGWPPLAERVGQLAPLRNLGEWVLPANLLRYVGWCGDQGVQLFLIASGFGLTWGLLRRDTANTLQIGDFYRRRGRRVMPLWWTAHMFFFFTWLVTGWGMSLAKSASYLSLFGLRITLKSFYYFAPAWWFIGLLLQLYLVYPVLWSVLKRKGPLWLLVMGSSVSLAVRGIGLSVLEVHLEFWSRGGFFLTRLPEFLFGMCLAAWYFRSPEQVDRKLRQPSTILGALVLYGAGSCLSFFLLGMTVAPLLLGVGAFLILYPVLVWLGAYRASEVGIWIGRHSYSLFLMHQPFILLSVKSGVGGTAGGISRATLLALILTVAVALVLERVSDSALGILGRADRRDNLVRVGIGCVGLALVGSAGLVWAELTVRTQDPQEVYGWGERPSLEPHEVFGWRLRPSTRTHLKWESYDYIARSNRMGFPRGEKPIGPANTATRILTIGDAFTSAEGVDTNKAWPRLLDRQLASLWPVQDVEVLNFAVTGYGPEQYAAVLKHFVPEVRPELIVVSFYVNEFQDVLVSNEEFRRDIGFGRPSPENLCSILDRPHLRKWLTLNLFEPIYSAILGRPSAHGYFLGGFAALEVHPDWDRALGRELVSMHMDEINSIATEFGAKVLLLLVPAPVQICDADQLQYYPRGVDLRDADTYDVDLPQRGALELVRPLGFDVLDLRPAISAKATGGECVYQVRNMHWTEEGHRLVASFVAEYLGESGL